MPCTKRNHTLAHTATRGRATMHGRIVRQRTVAHQRTIGAIARARMRTTVRWSRAGPHAAADYPARARHPRNAARLQQARAITATPRHRTTRATVTMPRHRSATPSQRARAQSSPQSRQARSQRARSQQARATVAMQRCSAAFAEGRAIAPSAAAALQSLPPSPLPPH